MKIIFNLLIVFSLVCFFMFVNLYAVHLCPCKTVDGEVIDSVEYDKTDLTIFYKVKYQFMDEDGKDRIGDFVEAVDNPSGNSYVDDVLVYDVGDKVSVRYNDDIDFIVNLDQEKSTFYLLLFSMGMFLFAVFYRIFFCKTKTSH